MVGTAATRHRQRHGNGKCDNAGGEVKRGGAPGSTPHQAAKDSDRGRAGKNEEQCSDHLLAYQSLQLCRAGGAELAQQVTNQHTETGYRR